MIKTKRKITKANIKNWIFAYAFIAPLLIGITIFTLIPIGQSFYLSLTKWDGVKDPIFIGFENFKTLFADTEFFQEVKNTFVFVFTSVPISICISLIYANFLNAKIRGLTIFRVIYFLPNVTMSIVITLIWSLMFNSRFGAINNVLDKLFHIRPMWLTDKNLIMVVVVAVAVWSSIGYNIVILLAGLQNVPRVYYEAAELDGAGGVARFLHITVPLVSPTVFFLLVTSLINAFNSFDLVYMFTRNAEGPVRDAVKTMVYSIYDTGFTKFNMGYASSKAIILFAVIMVITAIQMILQKKWVHY